MNKPSLTFKNIIILASYSLPIILGSIALTVINHHFVTFANNSLTVAGYLCILLFLDGAAATVFLYARAITRLTKYIFSL